MLTEDQILDEQVQTLEEALDKLSKHDDETITPNAVKDHDIAGDLAVTVECMKAMVDLYHTISVEGVSAADIKALRNIQARMAPIVTLPTKVALEDYEGMFTPNRTMINQVVSQEATLAEIGNTLKEWFFKAVDFVIKVVDWCRIAWNSETAIKIRLKIIDHNLQSMASSFEDVMKRNDQMGRKLDAEVNEIAKLVLMDPQLPRSKGMVFAFGAKGVSNPIPAMDAIIAHGHQRMLKDIGALKDQIEKNKGTVVGFDYANDLVAEANVLEQFLEAIDDEDYLLDKVGLDFWKHPKRLVGRSIYPPSVHIRQIQSVGELFRSIKRNANFAGLQGVDEIVQAVENITSAIGSLERMVKFKQDLFALYYKASATTANFYLRAHDMAMNVLMENLAEDDKKIIMSKLGAQWAEITKRMGL